MGFNRMTEQIREPNEAISPTLNNLEVNEYVEIYTSGYDKINIIDWGIGMLIICIYI